MRHFQNKLAIFTVLVISLAWSVPVLSAGPLDGQVFEGSVGSKGEKEGKPETISFKDGKFHSSACDPYGFGDGDYHAKKRGKGVEFTAVTENGKGAKLEWKGMVTGDQINATSTLNAAGEKPSVSWAKGSLKK